MKNQNYSIQLVTREDYILGAFFAGALFLMGAGAGYLSRPYFDYTSQEKPSKVEMKLTEDSKNLPSTRPTRYVKGYRSTTVRRLE